MATQRLASQITDLNKSLASVGTVKVRDVIARLGSASNGELDALASLTPKDSLLLTLGPCASPWVPFTVGAPGAVLAVAQPPNKAGTTNQSTASVLLTAEHLPPSMGGKAQAVKLTIPGLSFDDKKVDLKRGGYEISRCGLSHCDNDVHFHDVPATLVTASTDTTLGQKPVVSPEKKLFVNLCRLSR